MNYIKDYIPLSTPCGRRQGSKIVPTTLTIHNTGNPTSTARNERVWLTNPSNKRTASFHIVVDQKEAIECIPLNEKALHAGTAAGNTTSIGIEICESGDYAKALDNAAELVASMLQERGWSVDRLRRHYDWPRPSDGYRKICPRLMYDDGKWLGWTAFKNLVDYKMRTRVKKEEPKLDKINVEVNGKPILDGLLDSKNGVTYVPLRAVGEALGAKVEYDKAGNTARVTTKKE